MHRDVRGRADAFSTVAFGSTESFFKTAWNFTRFGNPKPGTRNNKGSIVVARLCLILVLTAGLAACASNAPETAAEATDAATGAAASAEPKKRCYREKETGTRLGRRVCVTVDE